MKINLKSAQQQKATNGTKMTDKENGSEAWIHYGGMVRPNSLAIAVMSV